MGRGAIVGFRKVKNVLISPLTVISPFEKVNNAPASYYDITVKGLCLTLYLISTNKSIGALLAEEVEGVEHPIHYLSR